MLAPGPVHAIPIERRVGIHRSPAPPVDDIGDERPDQQDDKRREHGAGDRGEQRTFLDDRPEHDS